MGASGCLERLNDQAEATSLKRQPVSLLHSFSTTARRQLRCGRPNSAPCRGKPAVRATPLARSHPKRRDASLQNPLGDCLVGGNKRKTVCSTMTNGCALNDIACLRLDTSETSCASPLLRTTAWQMWKTLTPSGATHDV